MPQGSRREFFKSLVPSNELGKLEKGLKLGANLVEVINNHKLETVALATLLALASCGDALPADIDKMSYDQKQSLKNELDKERKKKIDFEIKKPQDLVPLKDPKNTQNTNYTVSDLKSKVSMTLNTNIPELTISYSPKGLEQLMTENPPAKPLSINLFTTDQSGSEIVCNSFESAERVLVPYIDILVKYVLPLYLRNEWETNRSEIMKEWKNRMNRVIQHEASHANKDIGKNCEELTTDKAKAEIIAMQQELKSTTKPPVVWFELSPGKNFVDLPGVIFNK